MGRAVKFSFIFIIFAVLLTAVLSLTAIFGIARTAEADEDLKPVNVSVQGSNVFTYRADAVARQHSVERPLDLPDGIILKLNITYTDVETGVTSSDYPVNVGVYDMNYTLTEVDSNGNPVFDRNDLSGVSLNYYPVKYHDERVENQFQIVILPATLTVYTADADMVEGGEAPELNYTIEGFYGSDNAENSLNTLPTVELPDSLEVGVHNIVASGGSADNYVFSYVGGKLTVNSASVVATLPDSVVNINVQGEFAPGTQYVLQSYGKDSKEVDELRDYIRNYRVANWTSQLEAIYYFGAVSGGDATDEGTPLKISVSGLTLPANKDYFIVQVDSYGVVTRITNYEYADGVMTFESYSSDGALMIYSAHQNEITVAFVIAGVILILILLLIAAKVKFSNEKKDIIDRKKEKKKNLKW